MKIAFVVLLAAANSFVSPAMAAEEFPWTKAQTVLDQTAADVTKTGFEGLGRHAAELEQALTTAKAAYEFRSNDGKGYVLVDGQSEALIAMAMVTENKAKGEKQVVAINSPYPSICFYLGSFYNEVGKPNEALRVLDQGLALPTPIEGVGMGDHTPLLIRERGAALLGLKRWPDMLTNADKGLAVTNIENKDRAGLLRSRAFAQTELGRLDEAEKSYRDSLALEPESSVAKSELEYIRRLRAGNASTEGGLTSQTRP